MFDMEFLYVRPTSFCPKLNNKPVVYGVQPIEWVRPTVFKPARITVNVTDGSVAVTVSH